MTQPVLSFQDVTGGYGSIPIIRNVSGQVVAGECLAVLGRNGVGKSTLLKLLSGHLPVMSGRISLAGRPITQRTADKRHTLGLSVALQERSVFDGLSIHDNLTLMQNNRDLDCFETYFDAFPILKTRLSQLAGTLSGGERKILSFVRAMKDSAPMTLLDEPSEGVQPENIDRMANFIQQAKAQGRTFFVVEQHLQLVETIADAYQVLDNGRIVLAGRSADITREQLMAQTTV